MAVQQRLHLGWMPSRLDGTNAGTAVLHRRPTALASPRAALRARRGFIWFLSRRLSYAVPQLIGVSFLTFVIIRILPANPAQAILGPYATPEGVRRIDAQFGLNRPLWTQYWVYVKHVLHGDLGTSWQTSSPVASDLASRLPATLELTTLSLLIAGALAVPLGALAATGKSRIAQRLSAGYGLLAGALPDFWVGLLLVFLLYVKWRLPGIGAPNGQLDFTLLPPHKITGAIALDSLLTGNWADFRSALEHLILPVLTFVIVLIGPILKITRSSVAQLAHADFIWYLGACGYPRRVLLRRALRNAAPVVITVIATLYAYLLGGAVLVETVFSWNGAGQYAIQSIQNADLMATQGFVLVAGAFTVLVYFLLDLVNAALDPRIAKQL